jgi:hypothetical protein
MSEAGVFGGLDQEKDSADEEKKTGFEYLKGSY